MNSKALVQAEPTEGAFLDVTPPHWVARGLSYVFILLVLVSAIAAVVIKFPETITADFILTPLHGADPIKAARQGVVSRVFVDDGESVNKGETIATIRSESAGDRSAELMALQTQLAGAGESFTNTKEKLQAQTLADDREKQRLEARSDHLHELISLKRQQLNLLKQLEASDEALYREGIVSRAQLAGRQLEVSQLAAELERLLSEQAETHIAIEKVAIESSARQVDFRELQRVYRESTATGQIRVAALRAGLVGSDGGEVRLTAPCKGTILRMHVKDSGAVLHEGETVAELICEGEMLQAELTIPENRLGKLNMGQGVKLKYDAFPYQRYGVKYGTVAWLSPAADKTTLRARVSLAEQAMVVQGKPQALIAGMSGKAEIVVGSRSLIEFVLEPLRQLKENYSSVPERLSMR